MGFLVAPAGDRHFCMRRQGRHLQRASGGAELSLHDGLRGGLQATLQDGGREAWAEDLDPSVRLLMAYWVS